MASKTEETRAFAQSLFKRANETGSFGAVTSAALAEDVIWNATGSSTISGVYYSKAEHKEKVMDRLWSRLDKFALPDVKRILADGEWATVWFRTNGAKAKNGANFDMDYTWIFRVQGGYITELIGFFDGIKVQNIFQEATEVRISRSS